MPRRPRVLTRAAVFYGDRFSEVCVAFRVTGAALDTANVISTGTTTKLNRRYRGEPVESATRDKIVDYFRNKLNSEIQERLHARSIDLDNVLLPATFRLSDQACLLYEHLANPYRPTRALKADHIHDVHVRSILRGEYGVQKHILSVAEHIFENSREQLVAVGLSTVADLIEEMTDHNACFPSIYSGDRWEREVQLTLLPGGRV
jgi:hypothetical protein